LSCARIEDQNFLKITASLSYGAAGYRGARDARLQQIPSTAQRPFARASPETGEPW